MTNQVPDSTPLSSLGLMILAISVLAWTVVNFAATHGDLVRFLWRATIKHIKGVINGK